MPTISRIRLTNVIYEDGAKRYNDQIFRFDGENGIFLLENGGGKTVFIQTVLQAVIPHVDMAERKIKDTLTLDGSPAHIAIEWILNERPRRYALTAVSLFLENNELKSIKYAYDYGLGDKHDIEELPFVIKNKNFKARPADKGEISEYYSRMKQQHLNAAVFSTKKDYHNYIRDNFKIIPSEWYKIAMINSSEGAIEEFFGNCKTTDQLVNNLLIPTVEDALQGSEKIDFVQTFEKQREHFKQNKRLIEEIEQFKAIKEKVDEYISEYSKFNESEIDYLSVKKEAKAFMQFIADEIDTSEENRKIIEAELEQYSKDNNRYEHKKMSLEIHELNHELEEKHYRENELKKEFSKEEEGRKSVEQRAQNIEISELMRIVKESEERLKSLEEQLANVETSEEEQNYRDKKEELERYILGEYLNKIEESNKEKLLIEHQERREEDALDDLKKKLKSNNENIAKSRECLSAYKASVSEYESRMAQIQSEIFDLVDESNIEIYLERWKSRTKQVEEDLKKHREKIKETEDQRNQLGSRLRDLREDQSLVIQEKSTKETLLKDVKDQQNDLILKLESAFVNLNIYDTIYTKEDSIRNSIREKKDQLSQGYEEALLAERTHSRLADMYSDAPFFMTDTFLGKKIRQISGQVDYIVHGVEYLNQIVENTGESIESLFQRYPYWASSIVTTEKDKDKVLDFITGIQKDLTAPVYVMSTIEIKALVEGGKVEDLPENIVFPFTWKDNLKEEAFNNWKTLVLEQGQTAKEKRVNLYEKVQEMQGMNRSVEAYFNKYPYDYYSELTQNLSDLEISLKFTISEINNCEERDNKLHLDLKKIDGVIDELNQEQHHISSKIHLALEFVKLIKRKNHKLIEIAESNQGLTNFQNEEKNLTRDIERQEELLIEIREDLIEMKERIRFIESDDLYVRLRVLEPSYSGKALSVLKEELKHYEDCLKGFATESREIQNIIQNILVNLEGSRDKLESKIKNAEYPVEEIKVYYKSEIDDLLEKARKSKETLNELNKELDKIKHSITKSETRRDDKNDRLIEIFSSLYDFEETLSTVKESLADDKRSLKVRKKSLDERACENESILKALNETKNDLKVEEAKHSFGRVLVEDYNRNDFLQYNYDKEKTMNAMKKRLEQGKEAFENMKIHIEKQKIYYIDFCKSVINQPKLKDTAIKGVERKTDYSDLVEYQKNMADILNRNIKLAEDDRRESDAELQTFLTHLLSYSKNVVEEIDSIQHKTKIKVDGVSKQIFIFHIPKWDEYEAKESLRKYIDRLVNDYDKEEENLGEDREALRQFIERKLSIKNLIMRTLGDKNIKIKCRKVTSDLKINQAPLTWESSNKWSGGEKWSKNMTLFLSILNYLAEKKQYLSVEQKRHRTVILDNPFGKASSKHVLDPVFFVAENLGFQMITVTAHAEGKFVTDYFPVAYSGKLRVSNDSDKQIMELERTLNTVYLKTNSPDSLMRFDELEQLSFLT